MPICHTTQLKPPFQGDNWLQSRELKFKQPPSNPRVSNPYIPYFVRRRKKDYQDWSRSNQEELFDQAVSHNLPSQHFFKPLSSAWQLCRVTQKTKGKGHLQEETRIFKLILAQLLQKQGLILPHPSLRWRTCSSVQAYASRSCLQCWGISLLAQATRTPL